MIKRAIDRYLLLPDSRIGWVPFAIFNGVRIIKQESIDVIYASGEPFSSFISAAVLKKITHRPLVLDFRDDWVGFNTKFRRKGAWANFWEKVLEGFVLRNADAVITVNEAIKGDIQRRHNDIFSTNKKFFCINNGFDSDDFKDLKHPVETGSDKFTIVYAGSLYSRRRSEYFLSALKLILQEIPELKTQIKIIFSGNISPENALLMSQPIFKGIVENRGFLEHWQVLPLLKSAHLLLLIEDQLDISDRVSTGKIFEYMGAEKPILALVNEGLVKDMVISCSVGKVATSRNIEEIKECLLSFIYEFKKNNRLFYQPNQELIKPFQRKEQTRLLAQIVDNLKEK
jgi:glycosyltransferase involved in cell wall biosynthesis